MHNDIEIKFTKISATGNDFIVIDNRQVGLSEKDAGLFRRVCQRRTSVGADGVLLLNLSPECDFELRYFNADSSEAECGNGARAAAWFAHQNGLAPAKMSFAFGHDVYHAEVNSNRVRIQLPDARDLQENVGVLEEEFLEEGGAVNTGVPHYVLFAENLDGLDVTSLGRKYRHHHHFEPDATNVNFVELCAENAIRVRTYERGVEAETLSCGTGSVASAYITHVRKGVAFPIEVHTRGGTLLVRNSQRNRFSLEGEVKAVYEARLL